MVAIEEMKERLNEIENSNGKGTTKSNPTELKLKRVNQGRRTQLNNKNAPKSAYIGNDLYGTTVLCTITLLSIFQVLVPSPAHCTVESTKKS